LSAVVECHAHSKKIHVEVTALRVIRRSEVQMIDCSYGEGFARVAAAAPLWSAGRKESGGSRKDCRRKSAGGDCAQRPQNLAPIDVFVDFVLKPFTIASHCGFASGVRLQRFGTGHQRTNPSRLGILTCGRDLASS